MWTRGATGRWWRYQEDFLGLTVGGGEGGKEGGATWPRCRGNLGHLFIHSVGEDNRRRPSACSRHTWKGPEERIRMETTSVDTEGGQTPLGWF